MVLGNVFNSLVNAGQICAGQHLQAVLFVVPMVAKAVKPAVLAQQIVEHVLLQRILIQQALLARLQIHALCLAEGLLAAAPSLGQLKIFRKGL